MNFIEISFNNGSQILNLDAVKCINYENEEDKTYVIFKNDSKCSADSKELYNSLKEMIFEDVS